MIAAGKSTLARAIASDLNMALVSEAKLGIAYLDRLFENPPRWGYEAQVAFLIGKANQIKDFEKKKASYVLDRSIKEDAKIFFEYFREANNLDSLTSLNYQNLFEFIDDNIPEEDITIICTVDYDKAIKRIYSRKKFNNYVEGYVDSIFSRYKKYIEEKREKPNTYVCDGTQFDWSDEKHCSLIIDDIVKLLNRQASCATEELNILRAHV